MADPAAAAGGGGGHRWELRAESELRFEAGPEQVFTLTLLSGSAEIFGAELVPGKAYSFCDAKLACFTWHGAVLETSDRDGVYVSEETPMAAYANTHIQLEARRDRALAAGGRGPRVLIAGQVDSGKSSLASILASYAVRLGRTPLFIDLDVGQGNIGVPGTIGAVQLDAALLACHTAGEDSGQPLAAPANTLPSSNNTAIYLGGALCASSTLGSVASPLTFFYGHDNLGKNPELYKTHVGRLAACVDQRMEADKELRASGCVVNTAGWIDGLGLSLLLHAVKALAIDVVLVLAHDKLYADMTSALRGQPDVTIVKLPRSGGVVQRDSKYRRSTRMRRIHQYFYGPSRGPGVPPSLSPSAIELGFDEVTLLRFGDSGMSSSIAPIGVDVRPDPLAVNVVEPTPSLLHAVLAVVHPPAGDEDGRPGGRRRIDGGASSGGLGDEDEVDPSLVEANAAGFVHVTQVDMDRRKFRFLAPCPGALPSRFLVLGGIVWVEGT